MKKSLPLSTQMFRLCAFTAMMTAGAAASALQIVTFDNEADYNAAAGAQLFLLDFNNEPVGQGSGAYAGVDFGSPEALNSENVLFSSSAMTDAGSDFAANKVGPVAGTFTVSVFGIRFNISSASVAPTLNLFDANDSLIQAVNVPLTGVGGFFGLLSDTGIKRFSLKNGEFPVEIDDKILVGNDRYFLDNFGANGPATVPEPMTLGLLGMGLAAMGMTRRKSEQRASLPE